MTRLLRAFFVCACLACTASHAAIRLVAPDARTPDGGSYYGPLLDNKMHGRGRLEWSNGAYYRGSFERGLFSGRGVQRHASGEIYRGEFRSGLAHGQGRYEYTDGAVYVGEFRNDLFNGRGRMQSGDKELYEGTFKDGRYEGRGQYVTPDYTYEGEFRRGRYNGKGRFERSRDAYEGDFLDGEFTGTGIHTSKDGTRHEGRFVKWRAEGNGRYIDRWGNVYEGEFVDGDLTGRGRVTSKTRGGSYEGELRNYRPHGSGTLRLPNGDVYTGEFDDGAYHGQGTLTYAKALADGRTRDSGTWRYGSLQDEQGARQAEINVETALYGQRALLDRAIAALRPRDPSKINLYLLAIAGDGSQEVFRREVEFVRDQFSKQFQTEGRSIALNNSRNTVATAPMATVSSIRESLKAIASRMDGEKDILFVFLTSHGSETHELTLGQNNMRLRGLHAKAFAELLAETQVRWKIVVVSACYSGGFIDALKNEHTLIMTAARHDRRSFGCSDDSEFTYFGRAYFKEALPASTSFADAFNRAEALIRKWETEDAKGGKQNAESAYSLPQISAPAAVSEHVRQWWATLSRP